MSESTLSYSSPLTGKPQSLVRIGAALGIAATSLSTLIFTIACFGLSAVFKGPPIIALLLAGGGMVVTIIGATFKKAGEEDTEVFLGMFVNLVGLVGALLEMAVWLNWNVFYAAPTGA